LAGTLIACLVAAMGGLGIAQRRLPHVPSEDEEEAERTGIKADPLRGYQQRSVETQQSLFKQALNWVQRMLSKIYLTPARLCLILGAIGTLYTWGKNKRKVQWVVLAVFSWLLVIVGICAMIFKWPYMNWMP
jgi:hypothetical protein